MVRQRTSIEQCEQPLPKALPKTNSLFKVTKNQ